MEEQDSQASCWGVATWAVMIFLGVFAVLSLFTINEPSAIVTTTASPAISKATTN